MKKKKIKKEKIWSVIYFTVIGAVFLFTRIYKITSVPNGMHIDEISMGYNVWSLVNFGTDRYNVSYPVYFDNAGSGQSVLYVYITVLLAKLLGYNLFVLRFTAVILGTVFLIFAVKSAYEMFGIKSAYITAGIITIMPVFVMSERWAFDCNAILPSFAMLFYFSIKFLKTSKKRYAVLMGISISLCLYSYILAFIIVPVFITAYVVYSFIFKKISVKNIGIAAVSALIPSIPILSYVLVITKVLKPFKIGRISITDASFRRVAELGLQKRSIASIFRNLYELTSFDSYEFIADERYGVFYSNLHLSQILIGLAFITICSICVYKLIKKEFNYEFLILIAAISSLAPMLVTEDFAVYRYMTIFFVFALMLACAADKLWNKEVRIPLIIIAMIFAGSFFGYNRYLFGDGVNSFSNSHKELSYFDSDLLELCESFDFDKYADYEIYIDDTTSYNTGLILLYAVKAQPAEVISETENLDVADMTYKNIHIGIPEIKEVKSEKAIYIIRNLNNGASLYTDVEYPEMLYEHLIRNNDARIMLKGKTQVQTINGYDIYIGS